MNVFDGVKKKQVMTSQSCLASSHLTADSQNNHSTTEKQQQQFVKMQGNQRSQQHHSSANLETICTTLVLQSNLFGAAGGPSFAVIGHIIAETCLVACSG